MLTEKLELRNRKEEKIIGDLEKLSSAIRGTCIIQHGWGGHRRKDTVQAIKKAFLESGFQTFNFDTTNSFGESDGDFKKSTLGSFAEDFEDVASWVQEQEWFVKPFAVAGHSKGGYSALRYAEVNPNVVGYVVSVAPVVSGEFSFEATRSVDPEEFEKWKKEGVLVRTGKEGDVKIQHWHQMEERLNHDLLPEAQKLTMPVLLIVGAEDENCPPNHVKILFDAMPEGRKYMEIMEGAPHSFHKREEQEACVDVVKEWLKNN